MNNTPASSRNTSFNTQIHTSTGYKPYDTVRVSVGWTITLDDSERPIVTLPGKYGYTTITVEWLERIVRERFVNLSGDLSIETAKDVWLYTEPSRVFIPSGGFRVSKLTLHPGSTDEEIKRWYDTVLKTRPIVLETVDFMMCQSCSEIVAQGYTDSIEDTDEHRRRVNYIDRTVLPANHYWLEESSEIEEDYTTPCDGCGCRGVSRQCSAAINVTRN